MYTGKGRKIMGFGELKIWIVMKKEEKRWGMTELKIWNYMNVHRKRKKNHGFWRTKDLDCYEEGRKNKGFD